MSSLSLQENVQSVNIVDGVYTSLTNAEYHAGPGISSSEIKCALSSLKRWRWEYVLGNRPAPTQAMVIGSAVHARLMQPEVFAQEYTVAPSVDRRTKAGKEQWAEFEASSIGKTILQQDTFETVEHVCASILAHPEAGPIFATGFAEMSVYHTDSGQQIKVRPDWYREDIPNFIFDLKTTTDASVDAFSRSISNFMYYLSAAMYIDVMRHFFPNVKTFVYVVVEKTPPYEVAVYTLSERAVELGRILYREGLDKIARARDTNLCPGLNNDAVVEIDLPGWAYRGGQILDTF